MSFRRQLTLGTGALQAATQAASHLLRQTPRQIVRATLCPVHRKARLGWGGADCREFGFFGKGRQKQTPDYNCCEQHDGKAQLAQRAARLFVASQSLIAWLHECSGFALMPLAGKVGSNS
ncbi:MAG: hypothetical protein ACI8W3_000573 [Myxococcota bacterium]|jgi:hypothetical protein